MHSTDQPTTGLDPVFICGPPRCGVRLLATLLDAHPRLASGPELPVLITMARQWQEIDGSLGANLAAHLAMDRAAIREAFRTAILRLFAARLQATGKQRFVVQSFGGLAVLDLFAAIFPGAKFIMVVRDPREVVVSLRKCDWRNPADGTRLPYTVDAASAANLWSGMLQLASRSVAGLAGEGRMLVLRYEDLCASPTAVMAQLGAFIGVAAPVASVDSAAADFVVGAPGNLHPALHEGPIRGGTGTERLADHDRVVVERLTTATRAHYGYD